MSTETEKKCPNEAFNSFENKINTVIEKHMPLKKLSHRELKWKNKPWITIGIQKSMKRRDKLYKKFIKAKNEVIKNDYFVKYKHLRNKIVTLCRISKKLHYSKFFTENVNNLRNTWKGIKSIINIKSTHKQESISLMHNNEILSDPTMNIFHQLLVNCKVKCIILTTILINILEREITTAF